jgi:glycosyltransferase involved in cell wall biosynthesis
MKQPMTDRDTIDLCLASRWFHPELVGPGERFRRYAPGLRDRGVHLRVLTVQRPGLVPAEVIDGIPVRRVAQGGNARQWQPAFLYELLRQCREPAVRPHVLQFFSRSLWHVPFIWALRALGIPCLLVFTLLGDTDGSWLRERLRKIHQRWLFGPFNRIVTSSQVMTQELEALGVSAARVETIPNGVDLERFRPPRSPAERHELRRRLGMGPDDAVIIFVGGILPRKGIDILITAWHEVVRHRPGARLVLVGPRHEAQVKHQAFRAEVDRLVAGCPIPERIVLTGPVPNVEEYLRAADVFVFPSAREGMPNVVPEAMATGLPCVLTPFYGLPAEFGVAGREYVLVSRAPGTIARAILDLLQNQDKVQNMGERARSWVEQHLDVETSLDRFACLYRELAQQSSNWRPRP